jgi:predicted nucleotidyltransferase
MSDYLTKAINAAGFIGNRVEGVEAVELYGSVAQGCERADSDIDLYVLTGERPGDHWWENQILSAVCDVLLGEGFDLSLYGRKPGSIHLIVNERPQEEIDQLKPVLRGRIDKPEGDYIPLFIKD